VAEKISGKGRRMSGLFQAPQILNTFTRFYSLSETLPQKNPSSSQCTHATSHNADSLHLFKALDPAEEKLTSPRAPTRNR